MVPCRTAHINDACQIQYNYVDGYQYNDLSLINLLGSMFKSLMDYVIACEHDVTPVRIEMERGYFAVIAIRKYTHMYEHLPIIPALLLLSPSI